MPIKVLFIYLFFIFIAKLLYTVAACQCFSEKTKTYTLCLNVACLNMTIQCDIYNINFLT